MSNHKSEDFKTSDVEYYLTAYTTQEEVCKIYKCSVRSLMRWVDKYETSGEIKRNNRPPVAYKLHKEQVKYVLKGRSTSRVKRAFDDPDDEPC